MIPLTTYKLIHLLGIFLTLCGIGGLWAMALAAADSGKHPARRILLTTHGVALLLVLLGGFGMLARLGISGAWPTWIWIKLVVWLVLAILPVLIRRARRAVSPLFFLAPLLAAVAAWAALFHIGTVT